MMKIRSLALLCCSLPLAMLPIAATAQDKPATVRLCYENEDVYPWVTKDGGGLNVKLMQMVEQKLGVKFDMKQLPWKRCLNDMQQGAVDGAFAASFKADRLEMGVYPSGPDGKPDPARRLMNDGYTLYKQKGNPLDWDGKKFSNLSGAIAIQLGYSIGDQLKEAGAKVDEGTKAPDDTLQKVVLGRVQGAALQTATGDHLLKTRPELAAKVERVPTPLVEKPYFLMFSHQFHKAHGNLAQQIWNTIAQVRESADYKKAEAAFMK